MSGKVGHKRPKIRTVRQALAFALEAMELHARGEISSKEMVDRGVAAKNVTELNAAIRVLEATGIGSAFDDGQSILEGTGFDYAPAVRRKVTRKTGETLKGPIDEVSYQEERTEPGDVLDLEPPDTLPAVGVDEDEIPI